MNRRDSSLQKRLLLWLLAPLLLVSLLLLFEVRVSAIKSANAVYDRVLLGSALAIAERVVLGNDGLEVDVPYVALEMLSSAAQDRVYYQVSGTAGDFLTGYEDLPDAVEIFADLPDQPRFYDAVFRNEKIRVISISRFISNETLATRFRVRVAETVRAREALALEILTGATIRLLSVITMAALITWFGVGRGLAPLHRLEAAINRRSPTDLRKIQHQVPREVRHLTDSINSLMARLGEALDAKHRFTGNVAHQLRTPVAAMRTHTELAMRETDPQRTRQRLGDLLTGCREITRLINQLLQLAAATQPEIARQTDRPVDLCALAVRICHQFVPQAMEREIDLGFENASSPNTKAIIIQGDAALLEEGLGNLLDNALKYSPIGSRVTLRLSTGSKGPVVEIKDNGPGIPDGELEKVRGRFYRMESGRKNKATGAGLGLAIVEEIANRHRAVFRLEKQADGSSGLCARLEFPHGG